jgi:hypothetical protein
MCGGDPHAGRKLRQTGWRIRPARVSHRQSEISLIGVAPHLTGKRGAQAAARPMSLPGHQLDEAGFGDIAIRPLAVTCDGVTFGLIDESGPDRGSRAEPYPDRLGFSDPWDGTCSR